LHVFSLKNGNQLSGEQRTPGKKDKNKMSQGSHWKQMLPINLIVSSQFGKFNRKIIDLAGNAA
jgi:hypothetical protein